MERDIPDWQIRCIQRHGYETLCESGSFTECQATYEQGKITWLRCDLCGRRYIAPTEPDTCQPLYANPPIDRGEDEEGLA